MNVKFGSFTLMHASSDSLFAGVNFVKIQLASEMAVSLPGFADANRDRLPCCRVRQSCHAAPRQVRSTQRCLRGPWPCHPWARRLSDARRWIRFVTRGFGNIDSRNSLLSTVAETIAAIVSRAVPDAGRPSGSKPRSGNQAEYRGSEFRCLGRGKHLRNLLGKIGKLAELFRHERRLQSNECNHEVSVVGRPRQSRRQAGGGTEKPLIEKSSDMRLARPSWACVLQYARSGWL